MVILKCTKARLRVLKKCPNPCTMQCSLGFDEISSQISYQWQEGYYHLMQRRVGVAVVFQRKTRAQIIQGLKVPLEIVPTTLQNIYLPTTIMHCDSPRLPLYSFFHTCFSASTSFHKEIWMTIANRVNFLRRTDCNHTRWSLVSSHFSSCSLFLFHISFVSSSSFLSLPSSSDICAVHMNIAHRTQFLK